VVEPDAIVGVPEISPVAVSIDRPAGSAPAIEYVVFVGDAPEMNVLIGEIALPTCPVAVGTDVETPSGVVKEVEVDVAPAPLLLDAVLVT
jgi:hypothetical protein